MPVRIVSPRGRRGLARFIDVPWRIRDGRRDAPWVPVFNTRYFTLRSERMGGDPVLYVSPTYIPMHYEYLYVKDAG